MELILVILSFMIAYVYLGIKQKQQYNKWHELEKKKFDTQYTEWVNRELELLFTKYKSWQETKLLIHSKHPSLPENVRINVDEHIKKIVDECYSISKDVPYMSDELVEARLNKIVYNITK